MPATDDRHNHPTVFGSTAPGGLIVFRVAHPARRPARYPRPVTSPRDPDQAAPAPPRRAHALEKRADGS